MVGGRDLFNLASSCHGSYQHYSDDLSEEEVEIVGVFLQNLQEWIDISGDLEPIDNEMDEQGISKLLRRNHNVTTLYFF